MSSQSGNVAQLDTVIADYLKRVGRGETVDRERFIKAHREFTPDLREFFNDLDCVSGLVEIHGLFEDDSDDDITATRQGKKVPNSFIRLDATHSRGRSSDTEYVFGDYELLEELGRGGMGIVFKARQRSLDRIVCIKMMLMAELAEVDEYKRFRAEALAIARLQHPGIVAIHEVGQHNGTPYYTMEFIQGTPLSKSVADDPLPAKQAAECVRRIAEAIHVAHENGIVHRDLKPSNVLVDDEGRVHITDFGVAKHLGNGEELTVTGQVLGTPSYMSPEQASARRGAIGREADVYALGAILYALLTGRPPHRADDALETVHQVMTESPVFPRVLNAGIPADLETICMKCLEKAPGGRYASADELAADLRRFLTGTSIQAKRIGPVGRTRRWTRRHPTATLAIATSVLVTVATTVALTLHTNQLTEINQQLRNTVGKLDRALVSARRNELIARNLQYVADMQLVEPYAAEGDYRSSSELLENNLPPEGKRDVRGFEWHVLQQRLRRTGHTVHQIHSPLYFVCCGRGGPLVATAGYDATIRLYSLEAAEVEPPVLIPTGHGEVNGLDLSSDDSLLATAGDDGFVRVWEVATGQMRLEFRAHADEAFNVAFLRDDTLLLTCGRDETLRLWDAKAGVAVGVLEGHTSPTDAFALSADQRTVWSVGSDLFCRRFDLESRQAIGPAVRHVERPNCVAVTPDGKLSISGELGKQLVACNSETGKTEIIRVSHSVQSVAVSPDGRLLAAGDRNGAIRLWEIRPTESASCGYTFEASSGWYAHEGRVYGLSFRHDKMELISVGSDGATRAWDVQQVGEPDARYRCKTANSDSDNSFLFIPETTFLIAANPTAGVELWDVAAPSDSPLTTLPLPDAQCVGCSHDGKLIAGGSFDGQVVVWDRARATPVYEWTVEGEEVAQIAFSPDKNYLAVVTWQLGSAFRQTQLYRLSDGAPVFDEPREDWRHIAFDPDGQFMYIALDETDHIMRWDLDAGESTGFFFNAHDTTIRHMAISPCGTYVVSVANDRNVLVYDTNEHKQSPISTGLVGQTTALLMGPTGVSVAIADTLGAVRVCNLRAAKRVVDIVRVFQPTAPAGFAISSDGRYLIGRWGHEFHLFDLLPKGTPDELCPVRPGETEPGWHTFTTGS